MSAPAAPLGSKLGGTLKAYALGTGGWPLCLSFPEISGEAIEGQVANCSTGAWVRASSVYSYQWYRADPLLDGVDLVTVDGVAVFVDAVAIDGATSPSYTLTPADSHQIVWCRVTATRGRRSSDADAQVIGPVEPLNLIVGGEGTSTSGWATYYGGVLSSVAGEFQLASGASGGQARMSRPLSVATVVGQTYRVQAKHRRGTTNGSTAIRVSNVAALDSPLATSPSNSTTANISADFTFTATATTTYVGGTISASSQAGGTAFFDDFSVVRQ